MYGSSCRKTCANAMQKATINLCERSGVYVWEQLQKDRANAMQKASSKLSVGCALDVCLRQKCDGRPEAHQGSEKHVR